MDKELENFYGNRIRVRVCGLCWSEGRLLLVNHGGITDGDFWAPPGGGLEFGSSLSSNLEREFKEETGLHVKTGSFLFGCEFIQKPLHAIELFYDVEVTGGKLTPGTDPEIQIIRDTRFFTPAEILSLPPMYRHGIFRHGTTGQELRNLSGFYTI